MTNLQHAAFALDVGNSELDGLVAAGDGPRNTAVNTFDVLGDHGLGIETGTLAGGVESDDQRATAVAVVEVPGQLAGGASLKGGLDSGAVNLDALAAAVGGDADVL